MLFQICITFSLLLKTKEGILNISCPCNYNETGEFKLLKKYVKIIINQSQKQFIFHMTHSL